jgi:mono/diheme cytochrome c family protein
MSGRTLAAFLAGGAATIAAIVAGALVIIETGAFDVRASSPHSAPVAWATHATMIHAARRGAAAVTAPTRFTAAEVEAGLRDYDVNCVSCHGGPAVARAAWASGMTPSPPFLLYAARQWTPAELYWIIKHGVKMTGMPAWSFNRSDGQIWDLVALLEALPDLSPADYLRMKNPEPLPGPDARAATKAAAPR